MAKQEFHYTKTHKMEKRDGVNYATTYYKQTLEQRKALVKHIYKSSKELVEALDADPEMMRWARETALKGFPKTGKQKNRTCWEIIEDLVCEAQGKRRDGTPKDFAQAPIERWNKLFKDTDYEFDMTQRQPFEKGRVSSELFESLWNQE